MSSPINEQLPFFVYGTLRPGQSNAYLLRNRVIQAQPAFLGNVYLFSLGSFPMAVEPEQLPSFVKRDTGNLSSRTLHGTLITAHPNHYQNVIADLDTLEQYYPFDLRESMYYRQIRAVITDQQATVRAWIYLGNPANLHPLCPIIPEGDWIAYRARLMIKE